MLPVCGWGNGCMPAHSAATHSLKLSEHSKAPNISKHTFSSHPASPWPSVHPIGCKFQAVYEAATSRHPPVCGRAIMALRHSPLPTTQLSEHKVWHRITHTHPPWLPCHFCIQYIPLVEHAWFQMLVTLLHTCMDSYPSQEIWESKLIHHSDHRLAMVCTHSFPCQFTACQAWVPTSWSCCLICSARRSHLTLVWMGEWLHACPQCSHSLSQAL